MLKINLINQVAKKVFHNRNNYHISKHNESLFIYGGLALAATSIGLQYALNEMKNQPNKSDATEEKLESKPEPEKTETSTNKTKQENPNTTAAASTSWFSAFSTTYYDGGFESKMTKREAALILGVRETTTIERIKDAHRRILLLNHPDRGGSAYVAAKINEAKDLLLKGKN
jgi:hypothetical protein